MLDIHDNMDDLFKQAAAGYPLKTDSGDWNTVAFRLLHTPVAPAPVKKKKNKFNKYGPALLLVALMLVLADVPYKPIDSLATSARLSSGAHLKATTGKEVIPVAPKKKSHRKTNYKSTTEVGTTDLTTNTALTIEAPDLTYNTEKAATANKIASTAVEPVNKASEAAISRRPSMYWGIVFGPAINQVKNQRLQKPGFDIGIVAGIPIFKGRAFVETGLLYTQKNYYSDGRYFNMDKMGPMPGMEIMSLEGSSRLFEVPVTLRYQVLQKNRSGFFLSAGVSSYLMTSEENSYDAMMNGAPEKMLGSYKEKSRYMAVMANIGAEYNYSIGNRTSLRIEPYLQIPLKGIGMGSMPVMTTGLHIGLMRLAR